MPGGFRTPGLGFPSGLEPILFHPAIQGAAAQAQRLRRLAHVALKALQRLADQNALHRLDAEFFQVLGLRPQVQSQVGRLDLVWSGTSARRAPGCAPARAHCPARRIASALQGRRVKPVNGTPVARSIAREKMPGQRGNVFPAFAQRGHMNFDRVQAEQQVFAKLAGGASRG